MKKAKTLDIEINLYYNSNDMKCDDGIIRKSFGKERKRMVGVSAKDPVADLSGAVKTVTYACVKGFEWCAFLRAIWVVTRNFTVSSHIKGRAVFI